METSPSINSKTDLLRLVIFGNPYIKKNSQRTIWHRYLKRVIVVYSSKFKLWEKNAQEQLGLCRNGFLKKILPQPIADPCVLKCHFYFQTKHRRDISACYEGIQDVLVKTKILEDDNSNIIVGHDGSRVFYDKENPRIELWILKVAEKNTHQK